MESIESQASLTDDVAVIGVDVGGTKSEIALATRSGVIERVSLDTRAAEGPRIALGRIAEIVSRLSDEAVVRGLRVATIGVVCPGIVKEEEILFAPNLPGWEGTALARYFAERFDVESVVANNDVKAAALAEAHSGALAGHDPAIYLNLGTGLAAALVVGGTVVEGAHRAAGEVAYVSPRGHLGDSVFNDHAQLEGLVSGQGMQDRAKQVLAEKTTTEVLFANQTPVSQHLVHQGLGALGLALANMAMLVDPSRIALGGGMARSAEIVIPVLRAYLDELVPFSPELVVAKYVEDSSLQGALALALDAIEFRTTKDGK